MAIIENKKVYDHSKSDLPKLVKELDKANKEVIALSKSSKELAQALALVKKSNDGTEAKKLADGTERLTKTTKKLKDALTAEERVKQQILKQNVNLANSRTKAAKDLALVRQKTLEQNKALREQAKATLGVKKASNGLISGLKSMGKQLGGAIGVTALVGLLVNQFNKASQRAKELNKLTRELRGTFDVTSKEAKKLASQINAIAKNFDNVDTKSLQTSLTAIVKTFDDLTEQEALDLIQEGFQKGSNNSGEFLDILKEYPVQFKAAGIDAKTMFAIINQQVKQGIYSDKGVDAIKEGGLRLRENTKAVQSALKPFDDYTKQQIKLAIESGKSFEAIQLVSQGLTDTKLTAAETQAIIADVFGGAGEDAGLDYIKTLQDIETNLKGVANQTSIVEDANLKLSTAYNDFLLSVEDGNGIISETIASYTDMGSEFLELAKTFNETNLQNKLKILANAFLFLAEKALKPFTVVLDALGFDMSDFRFEIENTSETLRKLTLTQAELIDKSKITVRLTKEQKEALSEETKEVVKLTEAQKKLLIEKQKINAAYKARSEDIVPQLESEVEAVKSVADAIVETEIDKQKRIDSIVENAELNRFLIRKTNAEERAQEIAEAEELIAEAALNSGVQLAKDIFNSFQDEKLARLRTDSDSEIAILQQRLDDGVISEEQYTKQVAAIENKFRLESAKADKKKALFDIAIRTAIAIISALTSLPPNVPLSIAAGVIGGIQATAVLAQPLPLNKGMVKVPGQGNTDTVPAVLTPGESVINKGATSNSEGILNMVNDGLLTDKGFNKMNKQDNNMLMANLLMNQNDTSKKMLAAILRGKSVIPRKNGLYEIQGNDGSIEKYLLD